MCDETRIAASMEGAASTYNATPDASSQKWQRKPSHIRAKIVNYARAHAAIKEGHYLLDVAIPRLRTVRKAAQFTLFPAQSRHLEWAIVGAQNR